MFMFPLEYCIISFKVKLSDALLLVLTLSFVLFYSRRLEAENSYVFTHSTHTHSPFLSTSPRLISFYYDSI